MQIIEDIRTLADDIASKGNPDDYGGLIAYAEALCIIQEKLSEEERKKYHLDFDIEARYM